MLGLMRKLIPERMFRTLQPTYHYTLAFLGAVIYRFPSRKINVVAVTGTKGKSTTVELVNAILESAGKKTAVAGTIRFKIGAETKPNLFKMTMPGRFFIQKFLRDAVDATCDYAIIEMTSEGAKQFRHTFIDLDALLFLNLSPEHIESHGSYEKYRAAKLSIAQALASSSKNNRVLVVNGDDKESALFLKKNVPKKVSVSLKDAEPFTLKETGADFTWRKTAVASHLRGVFNIHNMLMAAAYAETQGIGPDTVKKGLESILSIRGRVEEVSAPWLDFKVYVDYAHTPDSLTKLYEAFPDKKKICVLGNTGGGRDTWKRSVMAEIADHFCDTVILTNEDPYDEDPRAIVDEMAVGMKNKKPLIIMDRGEAIREGLKKAPAGGVVLITGKGTDPCIMGPRGSKIPWDDATVVREELKKLSAE